MSRHPLQNVWNRYLKALEILKFENKLIKELISFKLRLSADIDATVGGKPERLKSVRVWHRSPLTDGVYKGGERFMHGLTLSSIESHAAEMSIKCWIHSLPFGGSKGGVNVDPFKCTPEELQNIAYKVVDELDERKAIGPFIDVPAPDVGTNSLIMFWMAERYKYRHRGKPFTKGAVTGKPVKLQDGYMGGIYGRTQATGFGLNVAIDELRKSKYNLFSLPETPTIIMQGFGNVGSYAALFAAEKKFRIIAVCDKFGGVFNGDGLNISDLICYAKEEKNHSVAGFPAATPISFNDMIELPCSIFMPNALEEVLTPKNADRIQAHIIVEGANGPTTPEADSILEERQRIVIPDIYANSMGLVVSFFEWGMNTNNTDNRIPRKNEKKLVLQTAEKMMRKAGAEIVERKNHYSVSLRLAAYILALEKAQLLRARRLPEYAYQTLN